MNSKPPGDDKTLQGFDTSAEETVSLTRSQTPAFLSSLLPFSSLNTEIVMLLHSNMEDQKFAQGEFLMEQGDKGNSLMIVATGEIEVTIMEGGKKHVLKRAGAGEIVGEMALLTDEPRTASIQAITPVEAWVLSAERFHQLAKEQPKISSLLTLLLASRLGKLKHDALSGKPFHGYRINRCLGRGGMSVVYGAEDPEGRPVALKMMSHRLSYDPVAMRRFKQEAAIVKSFDHMNIAKMYGTFEAFRTSFIVMELCEGVSIDGAVTNGGNLPESVARKVFGQVCSAVEHAHGSGIVHRDIKPANIMVNRHGTVKLIDFGLAGQINDESMTKSLYGTPRYMAPEQMSGGPLGKKIDLFALGHVAFEMLTGDRLFKGEDFAALRKEVIKCETPDFEKSFPEISPEFRRVLGGLLMRDPEDRDLDFDLVRSWAGPVPLESLGALPEA